jgi:hypothetical protein
MRLQPDEFAHMSEKEKEAYVYTILGLSKSEMAYMVAEFEYQEGKSPNAILVSDKTLYHFHRIGVTLKKIDLGTQSKVSLIVLPMSGADEQKIIFSEVDPWDPRWTHLFYTS